MHLTDQTQLFPLVERSCDQTYYFDYHIDHFDHHIHHSCHHLDHSLKGPVIRHITLTIILINDHSDHFDHHIDHFDVKSKFINKEIQSKKNWQKFLEFWVGLGVPIITIIIISAISKGIIMIITGHHQISIQTPAKAPPRSGSVLLSLLICGACGSSENNWDVYVERK